MYYKEYIKTVSKYLVKKINNQYGGNYLTKQTKLRLPNFFHLETILDHFDTIHDKNVLEVGVGNGLNGSIILSKLFNLYTGLEPIEHIFNIAEENCKKFECDIEFINETIEDFKTDNEYHLIIFKNSIFFTDLDKTIEKIDNLLTKDGIVIIDNPIPKPSGWGSNKLNEDSKEFDPEIWNRRKDELEEVDKVLRNITIFNVNKHELRRSNIYVLTR